MKQNYLLGGLGVALGVYVYEVFSNLYANVGLPAAITNVDWIRVLFVGLLAMGFVAWLERRKQRS